MGDCKVWHPEELDPTINQPKLLLYSLNYMLEVELVVKGALWEEKETFVQQGHF